MNDSRRPLFVARADYRRRRLIDAIKLVPVLGALLFLIPVLNVSEDTGTTLFGSVYLFLSWLSLIVISAYLSRQVTRQDPEASAPKEERDPASEKDAG